MRNSCSEELQAKVEERLALFPECQKGGSVYVKLAFQILSSESANASRTLVTRIKSMTLRSYSGENINTAGSHLRAAILRLSDWNKTPDDIVDLVIGIFKTCSVTSFVALFVSIDHSITLRSATYT